MKKQLWIFAICSSLCLPVVSDTTTANELELKEQESITVAQRSKKRRRVRKKRSSSKKELIYALRLARKQDYVEASKALYQLSRSPRYRKERQQIKYILGLMLSELGLYQTAAYQYVGVIQSGNTRYINTLKISGICFATELVRCILKKGIYQGRQNILKRFHKNLRFTLDLNTKSHWFKLKEET